MNFRVGGTDAGEPTVRSPSPLIRLALGAGLIATTCPALAMEPLEMLPDGKARALIGGLKLYHDPAAWRIDGAGDTYEIRCRGPECDDPMMTVAVAAVEDAPCSPGAVIDRSTVDYPHAWSRGVEAARGPIGLFVYVGTLDQGCRNWAGSPVYACTIHDGRSYWFEAPGKACHTSVRDSDALVHLLNGLSAAEITDR